ncbi:Glucose dehydrogenase [FAD, quinone] [Orchesella cincta]|uniref:Glucose dehydrogenase [FAD, quinone] n=1 Tax=Orchesella cincta TaxID=48709 RepID=A0A1D2MZW4_ORCCI|nr:Glucose dehydrogenase [FAD, quinone] [Orchesella cincta]
MQGWFYSTPKASPDWPNIFYILSAIGNFKDFGKAQDIFGSYATNHWERWLKPTMPSDAHLIWVLLARPKSRGFIKLADANPMSKPIIQPAYFSDTGDEDVEALIDGLEFLVKMYEGTKAFQVAGARMNPVPMPGCENYIFKSRRYFECVVKTLPQTIYHPSCTAPMGKVGDPRAVLDSELRVIGTRGLRVADASVMPVITNANLNAPTIMIGERAADLIKASWLPRF